MENKMESLQVKTIKQLLEGFNYEDLTRVINTAVELQRQMRKPVLVKRMRAILLCWFRNYSFFTDQNLQCENVEVVFPNPSDESFCKIMVHYVSSSFCSSSCDSQKYKDIFLKFEYSSKTVYQYDTESELMLRPLDLSRLKNGIYDVITFYASYQTDEEIQEWFNKHKDTLNFCEFPQHIRVIQDVSEIEYMTFY